jgi:acyl-CoA thioester hydrolase
VAALPGDRVDAVAPSRGRYRDGRCGQHIEYERELFAGDVLTVTSIVLEVRDKVIRFAHEMKNDETGETSARMAVVAVHLDTARRKARAFPDDVRERARAMIEAPSA